MNKMVTIALIFSSSIIYANRCIKCEVLRKYHEENPNQYEYYEDYQKACEEGEEQPKEIDVEKMIRKQENISQPEEK